MITLITETRDKRTGDTLETDGATVQFISARFISRVIDTEEQRLQASLEFTSYSDIPNGSKIRFKSKEYNIINKMQAHQSKYICSEAR